MAKARAGGLLKSKNLTSLPTYTNLLGETVSMAALEATKKPKGGYAAMPGTGPRGETCRSCAHSRAHEASKRYWKCDLIKPTKGPGTDIAVLSPACRRWERRA